MTQFKKGDDVIVGPDMDSRFGASHREPAWKGKITRVSITPASTEFGWDEIVSYTVTPSEPGRLPQYARGKQLTLG